MRSGPPDGLRRVPRQFGNPDHSLGGSHPRLPGGTLPQVVLPGSVQLSDRLIVLACVVVVRSERIDRGDHRFEESDCLFVCPGTPQVGAEVVVAHHPDGRQRRPPRRFDERFTGAASERVLTPRFVEVQEVVFDLVTRLERTALRCDLAGLEECLLGRLGLSQLHQCTPSSQEGPCLPIWEIE
jgi:hypothetical protein